MIGINVGGVFALVKNKLSKHANLAVVQQSSELYSMQIAGI